VERRWRWRQAGHTLETSGGPGDSGGPGRPAADPEDQRRPDCRDQQTRCKLAMTGSWGNGSLVVSACSGLRENLLMKGHQKPCVPHGGP
jgi:hypothetical protein